MEHVRVADDGRGFVLAHSRRPFVPWGFNYDHDATPEERLLEDYWQAEWSTVEADFRAMKGLGATVVRIHLQAAKVMRGPDEPDRATLARLRDLLRLAEQTGLRIDLTGLGCYRRADVPGWYDALDEAARWEVQARFWASVAAECASSPAIFAYNLMNEPAVPAGPQESWFGEPFENGRTYVEFVTRTPASRSRPQIARAWLRAMTKAIRKHDRMHLITVGNFLIADRAEHLPIGLVPAQLAAEVDYLSVHVYPKEGAIDESLRALDALSVGKPIVIEEIGPVRCSILSLRRFLERARSRAAGAIGFFWGKTIEMCVRSREPRDSLMLGWLALFRDLAPRP
jgi:hypothetical protein